MGDVVMPTWLTPTAAAAAVVLSPLAGALAVFALLAVWP